MRKIIIAIFIACGLASCDNDNEEFENVRFVPDKEDSNLPEYSELGYNTFGAKINRGEYFKSDYYDKTTSTFIINNGNLRMTMIGSYKYTDNCELTFEIQNCNDLEELKGKTYNLTDTNEIKITKDKEKLYKVVPESGKLEFRCVRPTIVDEKVLGTIVAGTFEMKCLVNEQVFENYTSGRFDFFVNETNYIKK